MKKQNYFSRNCPNSKNVMSSAVLTIRYDDCEIVE